MRPTKLVPLLMLGGVLGICLIAFSALGQSVNLVKEEMLVLDPAFKKIIDAVVLGDMRIVKSALREVHEARKEVEKAVESGKKMTLGKNQDRLKEFIELDDKFHEEFEALERSAESGNKRTVQAQTHKLLDACVVCHERFRK
jgi:cytochrome c556